MVGLPYSVSDLIGLLLHGKLRWPGVRIMHAQQPSVDGCPAAACPAPAHSYDASGRIVD